MRSFLDLSREFFLGVVNRDRQQRIHTKPCRSPSHLTCIRCLFQIGRKVLLGSQALILQKLQYPGALRLQVFQRRKQLIQ